MGRLDGKVAVITGGARGQGAEEGRLFASEGATVVLTDVLDEDGARTADAIQGAQYLHLDVRSEAQWQQTIDGVVARHGRIDVLVNNAGIDLAKRFEHTTLEEWDRIVAINQTGVFLGMRTVARAMIAANRGGSIINISSVAGMEGAKGRAAYGSTKWAVRGITKVGAHGMGRSRHPRELDPPGHHRNADDRRAARVHRRRRSRAHGAHDSARPRRPTDRHRRTWRCSSQATSQRIAPGRNSSSTAVSTIERKRRERPSGNLFDVREAARDVHLRPRRPGADETARRRAAASAGRRRDARHRKTRGADAAELGNPHRPVVGVARSRARHEERRRRIVGRCSPRRSCLRNCPTTSKRSR